MPNSVSEMYYEIESKCTYGHSFTIAFLGRPVTSGALSFPVWPLIKHPLVRGSTHDRVNLAATRITSTINHSWSPSRCLEDHTYGFCRRRRKAVAQWHFVIEAVSVGWEKGVGRSEFGAKAEQNLPQSFLMTWNVICNGCCWYWQLHSGYISSYTLKGKLKEQ